MNLAEYDFILPEKFIAERPAVQRDGSRLLVLHKDGSLEHRRFYELPLFLNAGDMLILNNSKVIPARLSGYKQTGGKIDILLVSEISDSVWKILTREKYTGLIRISEELSAHIYEGKTARFETSGNLNVLIREIGAMPLPPYIKRPPDKTDKERYQTVYAEFEGSIAAPTAGLHFTKDLFDRIISKSVIVRSVTLHIGTGTFRTVKAEKVEDHRMDEELFELDPNLITEIEEVKNKGNRIIAVGTTTTRTIEGFLSRKCNIISENRVIKGSTDLFIHEGYRFKAVDSLITNFHLPRSTPLMLTAALAGHKKLLKAYKAALSMEYRFFSYGDAMLVL